MTAPRTCTACGLELPPEATQCPRDGTSYNEPTQPKADPLLGAVLGEYQVTERVGEGGMGIVYRGVQPRINKRVAIKVLKPEIAADPSQVDRLVAEAQAVNAIGHRGVVDIFGFGQLPDGRHYIVMEYLEGQGLDVYLHRHGPLSPAEAVSFLEEICAALGSAHTAGIIHRDLKPSNVFIVDQPDGTHYVKLLDFGLAKRSVSPHGRSAQTSKQQIVGTPEYMSPEQIRGEEVGPYTDLYALGVVAFELLTGRLPFEAPSPYEIISRHLERPPPLPSSFESGLPASIDALVLSMLEKAPSRRPASAALVRAQLRQISRELASASTAIASVPLRMVTPAPLSREVDASAAPTARAERPQRRKVPLFAAAGLLLVVGGAGVLAWSSRSPSAPMEAASPPSTTPRHPPPPSHAVEAKMPEPVTVPPPEPVEPLPAPERPSTLKRRSAPSVPSSKELLDRISQLERRLESQESPDPSALTLLGSYRAEAKASSSTKRLEVKSKLESWERNFLEPR
ncbi:MAG: serine/threonine protein kinase [Myxococcota bacterium]